VFDEDPKTWLTRGPGKDAPGRPGWSGVVKPIINVDNRQVNMLQDPTANALLTLLFEALTPFPDARKAVADALNGVRPIKAPVALIGTDNSHVEKVPGD
jgi:hypothetical protein